MLSDPRVFFAAERTLLAWVRTGLTIMAFGFVVARFGLFLRLLATQQPGVVGPPRRASRGLEHRRHSAGHGRHRLLRARCDPAPELRVDAAARRRSTIAQRDLPGLAVAVPRRARRRARGVPRRLANLAECAASPSERPAQRAPGSAALLLLAAPCAADAAGDERATTQAEIQIAVCAEPHQVSAAVS